MCQPVRACARGDCGCSCGWRRIHLAPAAAKKKRSNHLSLSLSTTLARSAPPAAAANCDYALLLSVCVVDVRWRSTLSLSSRAAENGERKRGVVSWSSRLSSSSLVTHLHACMSAESSSSSPSSSSSSLSSSVRARTQPSCCCCYRCCCTQRSP